MARRKAESAAVAANGKHRHIRQSNQALASAMASCGQVSAEGGESVEESDLTPIDEAEQSAAHQILGAALRLRALQPQSVALAQSYMDVIRKFEVEFDTYARANPHGVQRVDQRPRGLTGTKRAKPAGEMGVDLLVQVAQAPIFSDTDVLESAVALLRKDSVPIVRETDFWTWLSSTNNLGCALTLLGRCRVGEKGFAEIEEAIDAFRRLLSEPVVSDLPYERATFQVNLSDALQALADLAMPAERVRYLERAVESLATALSVVAPERYKGLAEMCGGVRA
jgi:hypothetical protein